jgi:hypothetical protein
LNNTLVGTYIENDESLPVVGPPPANLVAETTTVAVGQNDVVTVNTGQFESDSRAVVQDSSSAIHEMEGLFNGLLLSKSSSKSDHSDKTPIFITFFLLILGSEILSDILSIHLIFNLSLM